MQSFELSTDAAFTTAALDQGLLLCGNTVRHVSEGLWKSCRSICVHTSVCSCGLTTKGVAAVVEPGGRRCSLCSDLPPHISRSVSGSPQHLYRALFRSVEASSCSFMGYQELQHDHGIGSAPADLKEGDLQKCCWHQTLRQLCCSHQRSAAAVPSVWCPYCPGPLKPYRTVASWERGLWVPSYVETLWREPRLHREVCTARLSVRLMSSLKPWPLSPTLTEGGLGVSADALFKRTRAIIS